MSDWYQTIPAHEPLQQGDILLKYPVVIISGDANFDFDDEKVEVEVVKYDVVVMSQTCDLQHEKLKQVQLCPLYTLDKFAAQAPAMREDKQKESLRRGFNPRYHLLNKCSLGGFADEYLIVDFPTPFSVPYLFLKQFAESQPDRISLRSPYREHLSQAYARFFMRVGLPVDIPPFSKKYEIHII